MMDVLELLDAEVDAALLERETGLLFAVQRAAKTVQEQVLSAWRGSGRSEGAKAQTRAHEQAEQRNERNTNAPNRSEVQGLRGESSVSETQVERLEALTALPGDEAERRALLTMRMQAAQEERARLLERLEQAALLRTRVQTEQRAAPSRVQQERQGWSEQSKSRASAQMNAYPAPAHAAVETMAAAPQTQRLAMQEIDRSFERDARRYDGGESG